MDPLVTGVPTETPVALVIQTRLRDEGKVAYAAWQARVGVELASWPGFMGQEVIVPSPPLQVDWIVIQRFGSLAHAESWLHSDALGHRLREIEHLFVGHDDI